MELREKKSLVLKRGVVDSIERGCTSDTWSISMKNDGVNCRYGRTGLYKALMFGQATVLATSVETCKAVLMAEDVMVTGWPKSTCTLMGPNSFTCLGRAEHHRLRRLTATSFNGHATLVAFLPTLHNFIIPALASWASASSPSSPIPLLPHLKKVDHMSTSL